ncbi:MAG: hypothetical protein V4692_04240 [Bdellovibrionota bacterium]
MQLIAMFVALLLGSLATPAFADSGEIIRATFSEIESVDVEWCADHDHQTLVCYATARTHFAKNIRAIVFKRGALTRTYVDSTFGGIDLFRLNFEIIGPLEAGRKTEVGQISLFIDKDAEIAAFTGMVPSLGSFDVSRAGLAF